MNIRKFAIIASLAVIFASSAYAQNSTPTAAAQSFYKYDRSHSQNVNRRQIDARKKWFSDELYKLFLYELKRQNEFFKTHPDEKPYFGDGLPFQPLDEVCKAGGREIHNALRIKPAFQKGRRAAVTAAFYFPKPCTDKYTNTYTIGLIKGKNGWVIDDVNFGEDRTLKQDLKRKDY